MVGHTEVSEPVKKALLKTWLLDCFQEDLVKDPRSRSFDDYKWMFDLEVDQLANEYELGIGKKGHMLDDIWEIVRRILFFFVLLLGFDPLASVESFTPIEGITGILVC
ncbi:hypothetical protein Tco_1309977 [Tanacetum coccineum]